MLYYKLLTANLRTVSVTPDFQSATRLSVPINRLCNCTGGARPLVARARAPVCLSLAIPLMRIMLCFFTIRWSFHCWVLISLLGGHFTVRCSFHCWVLISPLGAHFLPLKI